MKSHLRRIPLILLCLAPVSAEPPGIDQSLEFVVPPSGVKFIRWHGKPGRSYFVQVSDPANHLNSWHFATIIEAGNDQDISYEVDGTADKGFFRLKYTDQVPGPGETLDTADFDHDGIPNLYEIQTVGSDPLDAASNGGDSNNNGLADGWEMFHFGGLGIADPNAVLQPDGLTNKEKAELGLNPNTDYSAATATQPSSYSYDPVGRLTGVTAPVGAATYSPDEEGNLLNAQ
jgi:hypothetical protein